MSTASSERTGAADELTVRAIDPEERIDDVLALLQITMPDGEQRWLEPGPWRWKHVTNPFGRSLVLTSETGDGQIAGLRAFMRWQLRLGDRVFDACRPVDTATHPDFRRRGIFSNLTKQAVADARESGVDRIFNTPNSMSVGGYLKMGWTRVGIATPMLKVNSYPQVAFRAALTAAKKRLGRLSPVAEQPAGLVPPQLKPKAAAGAGLPELLRRHQEWNSERIITDSSVDYLIWRYEDIPFYEYALLTDTAGGEPVGACVVRPVKGRMGLTLIIEDVFLSEPSPATLRRLIDQARDYFKPRLLMAFSPPGTELHSMWRDMGFRWKSRSRINFVSRSLQEEETPFGQSFSDWAISLSELEIF